MGKFLRFSGGEPLPGDPPARATVFRWGRRISIVAAQDFEHLSDAYRWSRQLETKEAERGLPAGTLFGPPGEVLDIKGVERGLRRHAPEVLRQLRGGGA